MQEFLLGAAGYPALEILWRGRTHHSMALAGGLSMMMLHRINGLQAGRMRKAMMGGLGITAIEAACGMIWNRSHQVWDYRKMPLNWRGQICLPYTALWCLLSGAALRLDKGLNRP